MRLPRAAVAALSALMLIPLAACSGSSGGDDASAAGTTLTYWASNQGTSLDNDKQVLTPQLEAFTKQTGVKVNLEVVPWSDLLNRILAATTSGKGPDVLNIGNTWSASLQATGAFLPFDDETMNKIGGKAKFLPGSLSATGAPGQPPTAVPIYSLAYGLYYNKAHFKEAGIANPPSTWPELVADGKKLTDGKRWGLAVEGASVSENVHAAFAFSEQQGGSFFDQAGKPTFATPQNAAAITQYLNTMGTDKIVNPSNAEYGNGTEALQDFATGKASMLIWQAAAGSLQQLGMKADDIGVVPVPMPDPVPAGGKNVSSMVAGINLAVFKNTEHKAAALDFVNFMTSTPVQQQLNKTYGSLPSVQPAYSDPAFAAPNTKVFLDILSKSAAPMPAVPQESQFETLVGTAMKNLFADVASGKKVDQAQVQKVLADAQEQLQG